MTIESLTAVIDGAESASQTLSIYNYEGPTKAKDRVVSYFDPLSVTVRDGETIEGLPKNFALLREGDEFVAAAGVSELYDHITGNRWLDADEFERLDRPEILDSLDERTFTSYDRQRMTLASREIEHRAWREGRGELHAGFQRLSLFRTQQSVYDRLGDTGVDVHVYGEPDAETPSGLAEHAYSDEEVAQSWFVVYEAGESPTDGRAQSGESSEAHPCAMVAREQEDGTFTGCWTYDPEVVESTVAYLRDTYPPTTSAERDESAPESAGSR
ncbi:Diguanylate Cyclase and Two-component system sensory domain-containing protein [Halopelagius inordinatus]|uniref:Diguanylate Cyclase and Two-component system sensory domain-containing protein n=1 Tax=Halopelagius inordinatus TaxID=553467 RepID=A0A1I2RR59_9EURY|nr:DICT sensory domain-containing protein [Halopelagius inordinatus]SFG43185.1 Diguanylate Cyclase and Two-component system sensory domain-containing protein [Halopelagius inordinatus]